MSTYYNKTKYQFAPWMQNFVTVATANAVALSLDPTEVAEITTANTNFSSSLDAQEAARAQSLGATAFCDAKWEAALAIVSKYNAQFQAIPNISPELLGDLGLTVPGGGGGTIPVYAPTELSALGTSNGINSLKWKRNGNASGTIYVIEAAYGDGGEWQMVANSTRTRFDHSGQTPGQFVRYRVSAQRGSLVSAPSNTASVYDPSLILTIEEGGGSQPAAA